MHTCVHVCVYGCMYVSCMYVLHGGLSLFFKDADNILHPSDAIFNGADNKTYIARIAFHRGVPGGGGKGGKGGSADNEMSQQTGYVRCFLY